MIHQLVMLFPCAEALGSMDTGMEINMVDGSGLHPISKSSLWSTSLEITVNTSCLALSGLKKDHINGGDPEERVGGANAVCLPSGATYWFKGHIFNKATEVA
jgi:hypothetical protein